MIIKDLNFDCTVYSLRCTDRRISSSGSMTLLKASTAQIELIIEGVCQKQLALLAKACRASLVTT